MLLLIVSRMLRAVAMSICATQLNITKLRFLVFVPYFPFFFSSQKYHYSPNGNGISGRFVKDLFLFPLPKRNYTYFCNAFPGEIGTARESTFFALFLDCELAHSQMKGRLLKGSCFHCYVGVFFTQHNQWSSPVIHYFSFQGVQAQQSEIRISLGGSAL